MHICKHSSLPAATIVYLALPYCVRNNGSAVPIYPIVALICVGYLIDSILNELHVNQCGRTMIAGQMPPGYSYGR